LDVPPAIQKCLEEIGEGEIVIFQMPCKPAGQPIPDLIPGIAAGVIDRRLMVITFRRRYRAVRVLKRAMMGLYTPLWRKCSIE
jgi:hypothetical protein